MNLKKCCIIHGLTYRVVPCACVSLVFFAAFGLDTRLTNLVLLMRAFLFSFFPSLFFDSCLEGRTLEFYKWAGEDVKVLLDAVRLKIDAMAKGWSSEEKEACVGETGRTFEYGGRLLSSVTS